MQSSMEEIIQRLIKSGLTESEAEELLGRFLEENAEDYLEVLKLADKVRYDA